MSRFIDADALKRRIINNWYTSTEIEEDIDAEPTADVVDKERYDRVRENANILSDALREYQSADMVEVVRCKDCKHLEILNGKCVFARCNRHVFPYISFGNADTRTWFCADGERGEDVEETD